MKEREITEVKFCDICKGPFINVGFYDGPMSHEYVGNATVCGGCFQAVREHFDDERFVKAILEMTRIHFFGFDYRIDSVKQLINSMDRKASAAVAKALIETADLTPKQTQKLVDLVS